MKLLSTCCTPPLAGWPAALLRPLLLCGLVQATQLLPRQVGAQALEGDAEVSQAKALLEQDVPGMSDSLSLDVDRWVLHDILIQHLAFTAPAPVPEISPEPLTEVPSTAALQAAITPLRSAPAWVDALAQLRLLKRLRGVAEQPHALETDRLHFDIPMHMHPLVDVYIDYFTGRGRWFFSKWLDRSSRFIPLMQPVLKAAGLPEDLVYVAMIESGFSAAAYSTAAAAGYWQFINPTGKLYGLRHDMWVDERRDFILATQAAARYLGALYRQMGDWHLAWASYNAGEGRIRRAMHKYATRDFWELITYPKSLSKETMHYVPKVIAAAMIAKDPQRYGFTNRTPLQPYSFETIEVRDALDLRLLAQRSGVPLQTLRELNPALLHDITPPNRQTFLRVPQTLGPRLAQIVHSLPPKQRFAYVPHQVRAGDTLFGLARRFQADVASIKQLNHLQSTRLRLGQQLMIPRLSDATKPRLARRATPLPRVARLQSRRPPATVQRRPMARSKSSQARQRHVVSHGETLWSIARRYGVSVERISKTTPRTSRRTKTHLAVGDVLDIM